MVTPEDGAVEDRAALQTSMQASEYSFASGDRNPVLVWQPTFLCCVCRKARSDSLPPSSLRVVMALFLVNHYHRDYVWVPAFTAFIRLSTLLSMLITWLATGKPYYVSMEGSIPYISDIGADILKPLFVVGCSITGVGFFLCLVTELWLRHTGR